MNPFLLLLLEAGVNIAKAHVKNAIGGEVLDTTSFILDAAQAIDSLHAEENGTPLDWSKIREHKPLGAPGNPEETVEEFVERTDPENVPLPGLEDVANPSQEDPGE